ncbi:nuclear transport factor 2 family protein [Sphingomonas profundi]|uniref:nuclear transport factor 2 family protein n=1 Tax=Alterirhizorhabdus profundi TaxID=2681549 RepID=UPI0012E82463|nr:nuclear transport factor 2 family protein [Sphingomonas profundi]
MARSASDDAAGRLADIDAIATNLAVHSRGVDRNDHDLLLSAYHPDAEVAYGSYNGPAAGMVRFLTDAMKGQPATLHRTANMWIVPQGDRARSESYVIAYLRTAEDGGDSAGTQRLIGGRYLDAHEKRDGRWAIAHRQYVMDWNANWPGSEALGPAAVALSGFLSRGGQEGSDPGRGLLAYWRAGFGLQHKAGQDMTTGTAPDIARLDARAALYDLLMAYCRGVDRADAATLASVFHDDATMNAGMFNGPTRDFVPMIGDVVRGFKSSFHSVANHWFEIDGDDAVGESYVIAHVLATIDGEDREMLTGGRYLDRFQKRDGAWKIAARVFVADWNTNQPSTSRMDGMYADLDTRGGLYPNDPVYPFWTRGEG